MRADLLSLARRDVFAGRLSRRIWRMHEVLNHLCCGVKRSRRNDLVGGPH